MCACACVCKCVKLRHDLLPLPDEERGLLTSSCSGLIVGQDSALTLIRLRLTDPEMQAEGN